MKTCSKCKSEKHETEYHKHAETRDRLNPVCKSCRSANAAARYNKNKEHISMVGAAYYAKNKASIDVAHKAYRDKTTVAAKAYAAEYRAANKEKLKAAASAHYAKNKVKKRVYGETYYEVNKEKVKARHAKWERANPEARRIYLQNYVAKKRANGGKLSKDLAGRLLKLQKGLCACCGEPLGDNYHLDHIMPVALGGANEDWNIQLLRQRCNSQKRDRHPVEFMQSRGHLLYRAPTRPATICWGQSDFEDGITQ